MAGNNIYVQGSYIDVHDNENVYLSVDKAEVRMGQEAETLPGGEKSLPDDGAEPDLPAVLAESEWWQTAKDARLVGEDNQPTVSRTEAALLANLLATRLGIAHKWKMFERLWHRSNMRGDYNKALEQKKSLDFQTRLREIFS